MYAQFIGMFEQKPTNHLFNTFGCKLCGAENSSGYSRENYIKKCGGSLAKLYLVKLSKDNEIFYKVGITKQPISKRFKGSRLPYTHECITYIEGEAGYIFDLETLLHRELKEYKHNPRYTFGGNTECFVYCDKVKEIFINLI